MEFFNFSTFLMQFHYLTWLLGNSVFSHMIEILPIRRKTLSNQSINQYSLKGKIDKLLPVLKYLSDSFVLTSYRVGKSRHVTREKKSENVLPGS